MIDGVIIKDLIKNRDERGWLTEIFRQDELDFTPLMSYLSFTNPGVVRGPHEHVWQSDCFIFLGPGDFKLYLWDHRPNSKTAGEFLELECGASHPVLVIVPPGVIHGYKCISVEAALSINLPDKLYKGLNKQAEVDEIRWENVADSPYQIH